MVAPARAPALRAVLREGRVSAARAGHGAPPGLRLRTRRAAVIFDFNESIGSAHGDAFALRSGVLQTTVHVNHKSEYFRKLLPLNDTVGRRCGGPHDSPKPGCVYDSCCGDHDRL